MPHTTPQVKSDLVITLTGLTAAVVLTAAWLFVLVS